MNFRVDLPIFTGKNVIEITDKDYIKSVIILNNIEVIVPVYVYWYTHEFLALSYTPTSGISWF